MLEQRLLSDEEESQYRDYDANMLFHYGIKILVLQDELETLGESVYLSEKISEETEKGIGELFNRFQLEDRKEMLSFIKKYPNLDRKKLAKHVFAESEFFYH